MRISKKQTRRVLTAWLIVITMLLQFSFNGISVVEAAAVNTDTYTGTYGGEYKPESIFTNFQLFAKSKLTLNQHIVGAIATGGDFIAEEGDSTYFCNSQYVPSYVYNIASDIDNRFLGGHAKEWYEEGNPLFLYTNTTIEDMSSVRAQGDGKIVYNDGRYIDFGTAFTELKSCSNTYATEGTKLTADANNIINIPVLETTASKYVIEYEELLKATALNLVGDTEKEVVELFKTQPCIISITGIEDMDVDMDFNGEWKPETASAEMIPLNFQVKINGEAMENALKEHSNAVQNGQIYLNGMKLIWNFPDATGTVTAATLAGHLLAPNANVYLSESNFEGGIIADSIEVTGNAQGHFYPYGERGIVPEEPKTATGVFSKQTVSGAELPGATLTLKYKGNNDLTDVEPVDATRTINRVDDETISWESTDKALELEGLPEGEYTLEETGAPAGYEYASAISFKVDSEGNIYQQIGKSESGEIIYSETPNSKIEMIDEAKAGKLEIKGKKIVEGENAPEETYKFVVMEGEKEVTTGSVTGAGEFTFDTITYGPSDIGTHTYVISEVAGVNPLMTYDSSEQELQVEVKDEGKGFEELTVELIASDNTEISFTNVYTPKTGTGVFSKKAVSADGDELPEAKLVLTYEGKFSLSAVEVKETEGTPSIVKTENTISWTSTNVPLELDKLPEGEYTLEETGAPNGYQYATAISFKVDSEGNIYQKLEDGEYSDVSNPLITMIDEAKAGEFTILGMKEVEGENAPEETYEFVVEEDGTQVATGTRTGAGAIEFTKIVYGPEDIGTHIYVIKEKKGKTEFMAYDTSEKTIKVNVTDDGEKDGKLIAQLDISSDVILFTNTYEEPKTGSGTFSKKEVEGSEELPGAELTLTYVSGENNLLNVTKESGSPEIKITADRISWTSGDSAVVLSSLPAGEYEFAEDTAPAGYLKEVTAVKFMVDEDGKIHLWNTDKEAYDTEESTIVEILDETIKVTLSKKAVGGSEELPGAKLEITGTDSAGKAIDLSKVEATDKSVQLTYSETEKKLSWTSGSKEVILERMPAGEYVLHEDTAPAGYEIASDVKFKVDAEGNVQQYDEDKKAYVDTQVVVMYDESIKTAAGTFSKKEVEGSEELPGAELTLTYVSGENNLLNVTKESGSPEIKITADRISWTSGDSAVVLSSLPAGEYEFAEDTAPAGYLKEVTAVKFMVDEDGKIHLWNTDKEAYDTEESTIVEILDETIKVTLSKKAVGGSEELPGAKLEITGTDSAGKAIDLSKVEATDKSVQLTYSEKEKKLSWTSGSKEVILERMPAGEYVLYEDTAPAGYKIASDVKFKVDAEGNVQQYDEDKKAYVDTQVVVMYDESIKTAAGTFSKKEVEGSEELPGAELTLTYVSGENNLLNVTKESGSPEIKITADCISWTSGDSAVVLSSLPAGEYKFAEDTAPAGYLKEVTAVKFMVDEDGKIHLWNTDKEAYDTEESTIVEILDETIKVTLSKKAVGGSEELPGAKLEITGTDSAGKAIDLSKVEATDKSVQLTYSEKEKKLSWTSGSKEVILERMPAGEYVLREDTAPAGYKIASDVKFKVDAEGNVQQYDEDKKAYVDTQVVVMYDESIPATTEATTEVTTTEATTEVTTTEATTEVTTTEATTEVTTTEATTEVTTTEATTEVTTTEATTEVTTTEATTEVTTTEATTEVTTTEATTEVTTTEATTEVTTTEVTTEVTTTEVTTEVTTTEAATTEVTTETPTTEEVVEEDVPRGNLIITVLDEKTGEPVPKAEIEITDPYGDVTKYYTGKDGTIQLKNVEVGEYDIEVIEVPEGYTVSTDEIFTTTVKRGKTTKEEVKIVTKTTATTESSKKTDKSAKTGDNTPVEIIFMTLLASGGIFLTLMRKKKEEC